MLDYGADKFTSVIILIADTFFFCEGPQILYMLGIL
jgi:hypothetical protein